MVRDTEARKNAHRFLMGVSGEKSFYGVFYGAVVIPHYTEQKKFRTSLEGSDRNVIEVLPPHLLELTAQNHERLQDGRCPELYSNRAPP
jgi:hypothetical protein